MKQTILIFAGLSIGVLLLFELSKFSLYSIHDFNDVFIVLVGSLFILVGFLINGLLQNSQPANASRELKKSNLSKQEYKIFQLMNDGLSNAQIGDKLFIAESTVKTHVSKVLMKLNAKRRTEAIKIGRDQNII